MSSIHRPILRHHRAGLRALALRHALRGAALCAALVTLALIAGVALPGGPAGAWLRLVALLAGGGLALAWTARGFLRSRLGFDAFLERTEQRFPEVRSLLRNALDFERAHGEHTSADLARAVSLETERRLQSLPLATLRPAIAPLRPLLATGAALVLIVAAGLLWPARTSRSWTTLWNPAAAAPSVRLAVEPGSVTVTPGASLAVHARVWGTSRAPQLRLGGQTLRPAAEGAAADGATAWRFDLAQLTREQLYSVRVASVASPDYRIRLAGEPAPVSFEVEYRAPAYARLPVQRGSAPSGDLAALRGTRAELVVTFDRDLESLAASLPGAATTPWRALTPRRWSGTVPIDRAGEYRLHAVAQPLDGRRGEASFRYRVSPIDDAPPVIVVRVPDRDVDLPTGQRIPVEVLAQDDLGLSALRLQVRKDPAAPWTTLPLASFAGRPREARVATEWDASSLALLPGESASFRFELEDDNAISGHGRAWSPVFELRFPSLTELYDRIDERQAGTQSTLEKAAEQARELQKSLDKLARQPARQNGQTARSFERSEELQRTFERQQELGQQIGEASEQLQKSLEEAAERRAFDERMMRKLQELHQVMQQIQSSEFKDAMKRMEEALEQLDRQSLERNLDNWRKENQETLANLERTIELLKKLREEEKLQSLAQRAQELKAQQDELNRRHAEEESKGSEGDAKGEKAQAPERDGKSEEARDTQAKQEKAASESEELAKEVSELAKESKAADPSALDKASEELSKNAAPAQREASQSAGQGQSSKAQRAGKKASESLQRAAEGLKAQADAGAAEREQVDLAALRRAAQDLVSLQRSAEQNLDSDTSPQAKADLQTDLSEGTARVADSLFELSRQTPFIRPPLAEALGRAINGLGQSGKEMAGGNRSRGETAGRAASASLNQAILELRATEDAMCQSQGQGQPGGKRPNRQRLGEAGQRQSQLNRESRSLAERLSQQMRLSAGDREHMERLAEEQQRIRAELEQIRKEEESERELLGKLDQTEREMQQVEEMLRSGTSDGTLEEKQTRILSRLLDAERSLNRRDFEPQRESRPGDTAAAPSPAELPRELLRESDRLRHDLLKAEADRYPAQFRSFVEAYLRSLNGGSR